MVLIRLILILLVVSSQAIAILPLPYPLEPVEEEIRPWQVLERGPKENQGYNELFSGSKLREKELPHFENPEGTLGFEGDKTFAVLPELKTKVEFWKKIYSEYTSSQAVLHDIENPEIIYAVVDISRFVGDERVPYRKRMRALNRYLKAEKRGWAEKLKSLHANRDNPLKIPVDQMGLFRKFESIDEDKKFLAAAKRVRAQVGQRDKIVQGFFYGGRYFGQMMEIFEKKGVPKELTRLPLVESAFNLAARSKVGASGVWQFMRASGKRYLRIDRAVDERNDPIAATWAAAEMLTQNFAKLKSWPLAVTAYNHGPEGMARAVRKLSTNELPEIIRRYKAKTFGFASSNFYSEFLAILEIEREYRQIFGKLTVDSPIPIGEYSVGQEVKFTKLAGSCGIAERDLVILNPSLTDWVTSGKGNVPRGFLLKVPPEKVDHCRAGVRDLG